MSLSLHAIAFKDVIISIRFGVTKLAHYASFILGLICDGTSPCLEYCGKCRVATYLLDCCAFIKL